MITKNDPRILYYNNIRCYKVYLGKQKKKILSRCKTNALKRSNCLFPSRAEVDYMNYKYNRNINKDCNFCPKLHRKSTFKALCAPIATCKIHEMNRQTNRAKYSSIE